MRTDLKGLGALRNLRQEWQEDAGTAYPQGVMEQLLVLYDVCKGLELNYFEAQEVLGKVGLHAISQHINSLACNEVNFTKASEALGDNS